MKNKAINEIKNILNIEDSQITDLKRFNQGMSNYTYYFKALNNEYVLRLKGMAAEKYVDYENEYNATLSLENTNLTGELVYFNIKTGTKLSKYIKGTTLTKTTKSLAESLKRLHYIKALNVNNYNLIERLNKYESYNETDISNDYYEIKTWWINNYLNNYKNRPQVFCHNDLQNINIIVNDDQTYFIDFEYAAYNDIFYDFASYEDDPLYLFELYFNKKPSDKDIEDIKFYQIYQSLQWYQVALYKHNIGFSKETSYDFLELTNYFINNAKTIYNQIKK